MKISSSTLTGNKKIDILIIVEGPTDGLDDTAATVQGKYSFYITEAKALFASSLQCSQQTFVCLWSKYLSIQSKGHWNQTISIMFGKCF